MVETYSIASSELLLCADDGARTLGSIEGGGATDDSFAVTASATRSSFAADAGDVVPVLVGHGERYWGIG